MSAFGRARQPHVAEEGFPVVVFAGVSRGASADVPAAVRSAPDSF
ncbi:hypothetical protein ABT300_33500 [Streptomyces sp. NPDC001027]